MKLSFSEELLQFCFLHKFSMFIVQTRIMKFLFECHVKKITQKIKKWKTENTSQLTPQFP